MITAVDTNILLDVLIPDEVFGPSSKTLLDQHLSTGQLVVCEIVYTELASCFASENELKRFLGETRISLVYSSERSLHIAGTRWVEYYARKANRNLFSCAQCGHVFEDICPQCGAGISRRLHVLADFLIGAHALTHADCILSRDLGVYKTYFSDLKVVTVTSSSGIVSPSSL
jgi:predicted nucleic acid-binding protein